ncbi:MAG: TetR/AcrR family transcriptional regulator [Clostridiales bacterium]|nr:TetR/AcrR family transcriptional regulator [Clostridiales bacterium]
MDYAQRRQAQARQTEQAILRTALALMRERDFDQVSVRDICREAGITTGAFYHHFPSKEALLSKGFSPLEQYMEDALTSHEEEGTSLRLWLILSAYGRYIEEECGELSRRYYQRRLTSPKDMAPLDPARSIRQAILECLRQAMEQGTLPSGHTPEWLADFCYRHFRGVVIDWLLHARGYCLVDKMREDFVFFKSAFLNP